jgi:hypothetical protein
MLLLFAATAAGVLTRLLYVAVPRLLGRLPDYDPPSVLQERIGALEREAASLAAMKSQPFQSVYERALSRTPIGSHELAQARASLPPAEVDDFDRALWLLERRAVLRQTVQRRRLYRLALATSWRIHLALSLAAIAVVVLHILDAVFIRQRLS